MKRRVVAKLFAVCGFGPWLLQQTPVWAADEAPDLLIGRLTKDALDTIAADKAVQLAQWAGSGKIALILDSRAR